MFIPQSFLGQDGQKDLFFPKWQVVSVEFFFTSSIMNLLSLNVYWSLLETTCTSTIRTCASSSRHMAARDLPKEYFMYCIKFCQDKQQCIACYYCLTEILTVWSSDAEVIHGRCISLTIVITAWLNFISLTTIITAWLNF